MVTQESLVFQFYYSSGVAVDNSERFVCSSADGLSQCLDRVLMQDRF